ncbi:MAG: stage 0 sporulation family protein [Deltaproteobacteria bacterium]|nr:stage 0 sporulation family protein [Deltaproteobacteria bacterium]MBW2134385.1 stage 0 sporulation family protein [Deltaproteobacteria bacterium]
MHKIVKIRFHPQSKIYDFDSGHFVLSPGDKVIVETEQGIGMGIVVRAPLPPNPKLPMRPLKPVLGIATAEDLEQAQRNHEREKQAYDFCLERIKARQLPMHLVRVESFFDGNKMIFYFTADKRVDFRELVRDLVQQFHTRIELRQIGVRHKAKMIGGLGCCGRPLCCATFLQDFEPVSIRMAKEQNLSLNPSKISGLCGRLMCCLSYEYATYLELKQDLPRVGKQVKLPQGWGKVIRQNVISRTITVELSEGGELEMSIDDFLLTQAAAAYDNQDKPTTSGNCHE